MIKLVVGLQNPGSQYEATRHNAGAWVVQALAAKHHAPFKVEKKLQGSMASLMHAGSSIKLFLPSTFMNHSGQAVRAACDFYQIQPNEILVVHDELDLPVGAMRLKSSGGHGGHNGLRDMIRHFNDSSFHRLRIGIGHPGHKDLVLDYVLGKPSLGDKEKITTAIYRAMAEIPSIVTGHLALAMNRLHQSGE